MNVDKNDSPLEELDTTETASPDLTESVKIEAPEADAKPPVEADMTSWPEWSLLCQKITEIHDSLVNRIKYDAVKERAFERLYGELDELKKNKAFEDYRALFVDLLLLYDRVQLFKKDYSDSGFDVLDSIQEELIEILLRRDIEMIQTEEGCFDPRFQRIVKTQEVSTSDLDGKVIQILRDGFVSKFGILRPQEVIVGRYISATNDTTPITESEKT